MNKQKTVEKTKDEIKTEEKASLTKIKRGMKAAAARIHQKTKDGVVRVTSGTYHEELSVVGATIKDVVSTYADSLDLHPECVAVVNGNPENADYVIKQEDTLIFVRPSGEKG